MKIQKIQKIQIQNYRAFYGSYEIEVNGQNLLVYGENGSGKSSLINAFFDFFKSAELGSQIKFEVNKWVEKYPNSDIPEIKITFQKVETKKVSSDESSPTPQNVEILEVFFNESSPTPQTPLFLQEVGKQTPFFTYRRLLKTYLVDKGEIERKLFLLLVEDVLADYRTPEDYLIKDCWEDVPKLSNKTGALDDDDRNDRDYLIQFSETLKSAVDLLTLRCNQFLTYFDTGIVLKLSTPTFSSHAVAVAKLREEMKAQYENAKLDIQLSLFGEPINDYHHFLNEARLSALAICFYLASMKEIPQPKDIKILFLDDIFIGLDSSNRKPLLDILNNEFSDWQIFITTYDRQWFELAKHSLNKESWSSFEMYVGQEKDYGFEMPLIISPSDDYYNKAKKYFNKKAGSQNLIDYPAAANYLRKECERKIKEILSWSFLLKSEGDDLVQKQDITELFVSLKAIFVHLKLDFKDFIKFPGVIKSSLNPLSHDNPDKPIYRDELEEAFVLVDNLRLIERVKVLRKDEIIFCLIENQANITRKAYLKNHKDDFTVLRYKNQIGISKHLFEAQYYEQNGLQESLDNKVVDLSSAYKKIYHHHNKAAISDDFDVYSLFYSQTKNKSLRDIIETIPLKSH